MKFVLTVISALITNLAVANNNDDIGLEKVTSVLAFASTYTQCLNEVGISPAITGDLSTIEKYASRVKKYRKNRAKNISKLMAELELSEDVLELYRANLADDQSKPVLVSKREREALNRVIKFSGRLYRKELKLYGVLDSWGYQEADLPNLSFFTCFLLASEHSVDNNDYREGLSLTPTEQLQLGAIGIVITPAMGINRLLGTERIVSFKNIMAMAGSPLSKQKLLSDRCDIGTQVSKDLPELLDNEYFEASLSFGCEIAESESFNDVRRKRQRFFNLGVDLLSKGIERVDRDSEYAVLFKELQGNEFKDGVMNAAESFLSRAVADANLELVLYKSLVKYFYTDKCSGPYRSVIVALQNLVVAEERQNTKFFFRVDSNGNALSKQIQRVSTGVTEVQCT